MKRKQQDKQSEYWAGIKLLLCKLHTREVKLLSPQIIVYYRQILTDIPNMTHLDEKFRDISLQSEKNDKRKEQIKAITLLAMRNSIMRLASARI